LASILVAVTQQPFGAIFSDNQHVVHSELMDQRAAIITLVALFVETLPMLAELVRAAKPLPGVLAVQIRDCLSLGGSGTYEGLIALMAPMLGKEGLARLTELFLAALDDKRAMTTKASVRPLCVILLMLRAI
jgi:hypothetical protein